MNDANIDIKTNLSSKDLFKQIISKYFFRLLGLTNRNIDDISKEDEELIKNKKKSIFYFNQFIYFVFSLKNKIAFKVSVNEMYSNMNFKYEIKILDDIIKTISSLSNTQNLKNYLLNSMIDCTIDSAMCKSIFNGKETKLYDLLLKLKEWSTKTYEGKRVPFAFIVDIDNGNASNEQNLDYLKFLDLDFCATLSDGITSVITLDKNCNFVSYESLVVNNKVIGSSLYNAMPLRFAQILDNYVKGKNKIGIFLLINGDILLAKNREILYVYRNQKWISFSWERMYYSLMTTLKMSNKDNEIEILLKEIYASTLDVSFAHTGGIIAIVNSNDEFFSKNCILSCMDDLYNNFNLNKDELREKFIQEYKDKNNKTEITDKTSKILENDFEKRYLKLSAIKTLIEIKNKPINFVDINRKLRAELIGLDGATIINLNGELISVGAIIQNEKGSSGGGRGAAASKLSDYQGFAIKISTDGYVELYDQKEICYQIK